MVPSIIDVSKLAASDRIGLLTMVNGALAAAGVKAFVVGGWVRDTLVGREVDDLDFAVPVDGIEIASSVARAIGGTCVPLDVENGVGRVVLPPADVTGGTQLTLDFASLQGSLEDDLARRDFTIDALAVDLGALVSRADQSVIDPRGGLGDLGAGIIRATASGVFSADPVRLLRAIRLAASLRFIIEPLTEAQMRKDARLLSKVAGERIREELVSLLSLAGSGRFCAYMDSLGLLVSIIPEAEGMRGVTQPKEHAWDVLTHCLKSVEALDCLFRQAAWPHAGALDEVPWDSESAGYFGVKVGAGTNRAALFRLAALLHDIAKPQTKSVEESGKMRFIGHGEEGAETVRVVLERLRFSNREIKMVETAVRYHLRPTQMGWPCKPTKRALYRFFRDTGDAATGIVYLSLADHMAARGPHLDPEEWALHASISRYVLSQRAEEPARPGRLIDGYDIMKTFGLSPGHRVGQLLESVREAQASGEISSRDEAFALVGRVLASVAWQARGQSEEGK
jgi:poly(A) polymerase